MLQEPPLLLGVIWILSLMRFIPVIRLIRVRTIIRVLRISTRVMRIMVYDGQIVIRVIRFIGVNHL